MFYIAVMDCKDELHMLLGNRAGKIKVGLDMKVNDGHLPYEMHYMMSVDLFLITFFICIAAYNFYSWQLFVRRHDIKDSPHTICMIAMVL